MSSEMVHQNEEEGWGAWMWSYIPVGFSGWTQESASAATPASHLPSSVFHMGFFIKKASFIFKAVLRFAFLKTYQLYLLIVY